MKIRNFQFLLLFLFGIFTTGILAQQEVSGVVRSDDGELLPGVSVVLKGTTNGVTSDFDGNYSITVPTSESVLVFSYLGMLTQEIIVGNRSTIDVSLATSSQELDEVVVIGSPVFPAEYDHHRLQHVESSHQGEQVARYHAHQPAD